MRILVISHEYPPIGGGGANACFFLTREFVRQGHQVTIVTAQFDTLPQFETTDDGVHIFRVVCKRKNKEKSSFQEMLSYLVSAWKKTEELLKTEHYDKCLVFFGIPSGPLALHLKRKYKLPYVVRFGGGDIPGAQKRFKYIYKILEPTLRSIWKNADGLIANSEGLRARALAFEERYPIQVIENGVDNTFFLPNTDKKEKDEITILFVSRLIEGKGLQYLIPDMKSVQEQVLAACQKSVRLVIVGDGPYRSTLEELTDQTQTRAVVSFVGRKDKEQVKQYYQEADVFVLPSLSEGMPNVVLEAMASGLPIVMTPCEGSKELVTDNGIISPLESLTENLVRICTDQEMRQKMGQNSLLNVEKSFQWESIAKRYMNILEQSTGE